MPAKIISIFSTKGGVGKTILSLNLATGLSLKRKKTILLDLDLKAPQATFKLMEVKCKYSLYNLMSIFDKIKTGERKLENYLARHSCGLDFLPAILHTREKFAMKPEFIRDFLLFVTQEYDYIIIDAGTNLTDQLITVFDLSNLLFLVLTPDIASIYQTKWSIDMLQSLGFPLKMIKVVLNRAESRGGVSLQEIKLLLLPEIIALIPSDGRTVGLSVNRRVPLMIDSPRAKVSGAIEKLCDDLINKENIYIKRRELSQVRIEKAKDQVQESFLKRAQMQEPAKELQEEEDMIVRLKKKVHSRLIDEIDLKRLPIEKMLKDAKKSKELIERAQRVITNIIADEAGGFITSLEVRKKIIKEILDEALGLGPLEDLLKDPTITEIMVNNKDQVYIERAGKIELTTKKFTSNEQVRVIIERILAPLGRRIDESSPYVDARLADGSRVNAIISPLSLTGATLTIRKFSKERLTINDLVRKLGSLTHEMALFLEACVKAEKNILVTGGTGSGKTTFLNILSEFIRDRERIVTIEDSAELKLHHQHWIRLESRPPNIEGKGEIGIRELFRNSLRMRPDRIIVGECRGKEVLDMLQAMNTGHDGSMSTLHANSPKDVLIRLDSMILMSGVELPMRAIREIISSALHLIVHTARMSDGSRKVTNITEVCGLLGDAVELKEIFSFKQKGVDEEGKVLGDFTPSNNIPSFHDEIIARGIHLPKSIFTL